LTARQRSLVLDAIGKQLMHEPMVETRNRKPLRPNPVALGNCEFEICEFSTKSLRTSPML
jgi:hypothetical protein